MNQFSRKVLQLVGIIFLAGGVGLLAAYAVLKPELPESEDLWKANRTRAITFLDPKGEVIGSRGGLHTKPLRLKEMPPHLKKAFLTTEDKRFYDHGAIDWIGIARAMFINIMEGGVVQGGSSITQQLAKNIFLTQERTIARKVKEVILARQLEERLSKDEILELYLNRIYLGAGSFGVEAASQTYFDKSARDVTLSEAAMLAGLAKAPSRYNPTTNLNRARQRTEVVLKLLRDNDVITDTQYAMALVEPAQIANRYVSGEVNYFLDHVTSEVNNIEAVLEEEFDYMPSIDLVVTTTLNSVIQANAEQAVTNILDRSGEALKAEQGALVALAKDGAIRAMVGGRSYKESQFNRAVQAQRQPGSAFKPFVYLTALQQGRPATASYYDEPITIDKWTPSNYSGGYRGRVTMIEALQHSINTVAVRVSEEIGRENIISTAQKMGIDSHLTKHPSLALGASEVNLLELTSAYIPFSNRGFSADAYSVLKIETTNDNVLWEKDDTPNPQVISPKMAEAMTHMMYQVVINGTGKRANLGERPSAGKTGTSQEWRDAWYMGYTGDLVTGVWVGNDDASPMERVTGGGLPAEIWKQFMAETHKEWQITALPGSYPARAPAREKDMKRFLADLTKAFKKIEKKPKGQKRKWWPFGD